jgi:SAM-dependent methyltransferase
LDIGCGLGGTVGVFSEQGWQSSGFDPDPNTKYFHNKQLINTQIGRLDEVALDPPCDLICMAHAIYFVENPKEFFKNVRALLNPKGFFLILVSDLFSSRSLGRPGIEHTWYPTRYSCRFLFEQSGFELVSHKFIKGTDMMLFRISESAHNTCGRPWHAFWLHRSQILRHKTWGKIANLVVKIGKSRCGYSL